MNDKDFRYRHAREMLREGNSRKAIEVFKQMYILKPYDNEVRRKTHHVYSIYYLFMHTYFSGRVVSIDWSSDGRYFLVAFSSPVLGIWDAHRKTLIRKFNHGEYSVQDGSWSHVDRNLFAITADWYLFVFDALRGLLVHELKASEFAENYNFSSIAWSPIRPNLAISLLSDNAPLKLDAAITNLREVLSDSDNKSNVILLDSNTNRVTNIYSGRGTVFSMSWSPNGQKMALGFNNGTLVINDMKNKNYDKYSFEMPIIDVSWSPKGGRIALAFWNGRLGIFDVEAENLKYVYKSSEKVPSIGSDLPPRIFSVSWDPNGRRVAFASESGDVRVLDIENSHVLTLFKHSSAATMVSWSPDGKHIIAGFNDGLVMIYSAETGKELKRIENRGNVGVFTDYDEVSKLLAFAISSDHYGELQFWDVSEFLNERVMSRYTFSKGFKYISFSLGGKYFAVVHRDGAVRLWKISNGKLKFLNEFKFYDISSKVAWRSDGKYVAVGTRYGSIVLFNVETGNLRWWHVSDESIEEVAWSPDGKLIAALDLMGFLVVTKPYSKKWLINQPYANEAEFRNLKWNSDEYVTLINTGWDELLYINLNGDVAKRISLRCKFDGKPRFCKGLSYDFSPSGRYAVVSLEDKKIKVIDTRSFDVLKEWEYPYYVRYLKWLDEKRILACDSHRDWFVLVI
ncbi:MAG: WD40 repeat domain-containing protein [Candidatus Asgardarchaeia archaeon]